MTAENVSFDFSAIVARSRAVTKKISKGVGYLLKKNAVQHVTGTARLAGSGRVLVDGPEGQTAIKAKHVIVATGARARSLPGVTIDGERILSYREAMTLQHLPKSLIRHRCRSYRGRVCFLLLLPWAPKSP